MTTPVARTQEIFAAALEVESRHDRAAILDRACGDDPELRAEIESMLAAHDEQGDFLARPSSGGPEQLTLNPGLSEAPGDVIGRYKLLQQIGEGGFGVVYMAEQEEPVRRKVALKIIKLGMDTKQVIARFEAERQALAMMDHPNIAKVFDAGATDTGRPFFVMELVRGEPITEYCDKQNLSVEGRLELFQQVCNAVQHAHQKGIIHRDIKPNNVMITLHDGKPVPKVIDFGIAKATNARLTEKTLFTEYRQFIGTPEYMSPEQAEMSGIDIDTRSDVYSLGVLLYELLTGTTPFDGKKLRSAGYGEIQRIIREETPQKPSTRLSTLETLPSIAAHRHTEAKKLGLLLRGDLDWIVMKALEKDRTRRYETASGFAKDIERYLNDETVTATPPSNAYRLRKLIRRNKGVFTAAAVVCAALTLGVIGTTCGLVWAMKERARVTAQADRAGDALRQVTEEFADRVLTDNTGQVVVPIADSESDGEVDALALTAVNLVRSLEAAYSDAERELGRATEVKHLITEMLTSVDPARAQTTDIALLKDILENAAGRLERGEIKDELVAAELRHTVAFVYHQLGLYDLAAPHYEASLESTERLLGEENPATLTVMQHQAQLFVDQARYAEAESQLLRTHELRTRILGEEHPETIRTLNALAVLYAFHSGRLEQATKWFEQVLAVLRRLYGDNHRDTLTAINNLANAYSLQARNDEATPLLSEALEIRTDLFGQTHPDTVQSLNNLAHHYVTIGRYDDALPLQQRVVEISRQVHGPEHPLTQRGLYGLANIYWSQSRYDEAAPVFDELLEAGRRELGPEHAWTLTCMSMLAVLYADQNRLAEAETLQRESFELRRRVLGADHPDTLWSMHNLADLYTTEGRYAEAEPLAVQVLEVRRRVLGEHHPDTLFALNNLGWLYLNRKRYDEAETVIREAYEAHRNAGQMDVPNMGRVRTNLVRLYRKQGRTEDLHPLLVDQFNACQREASVEYATAWALDGFALELLLTDLDGRRDPARGLELAQRACALAESTGGAHLWRFLDTVAMAQHINGDTASAVETQKRAIELAPDDDELEATLATYEAAMNASDG